MAYTSGEVFRPDKPDNAASPVYPDGTTLLVFNPATKKAAVVRVNNAGPYWGRRKLDVSRATADKLGFKHRGVAALHVKVVRPPANKAEATYRKHRRYKPVPGYIGEFANAGEANIGMAAIMALEAMATSLLAPASSGLMTAARGDRIQSEEVLLAHKSRKGTRLALAERQQRERADVAATSAQETATMTRAERRAVAKAARMGMMGTRLAGRSVERQLHTQAQEGAGDLGKRLKAAVWKSRKASRHSRARQPARTFI